MATDINVSDFNHAYDFGSKWSIYFPNRKYQSHRVILIPIIIYCFYGQNVVLDSFSSPQQPNQIKIRLHNTAQENILPKDLFSV